MTWCKSQSEVGGFSWQFHFHPQVLLVLLDLGDDYSNVNDSTQNSRVSNHQPLPTPEPLAGGQFTRQKDSFTPLCSIHLFDRHLSSIYQLPQTLHQGLGGTRMSKSRPTPCRWDRPIINRITDSECRKSYICSNVLTGHGQAQQEVNNCLEKLQDVTFQLSLENGGSMHERPGESNTHAKEILWTRHEDIKLDIIWEKRVTLLWGESGSY